MNNGLPANAKRCIRCGRQISESVIKCPSCGSGTFEVIKTHRSTETAIPHLLLDDVERKLRLVKFKEKLLESLGALGIAEHFASDQLTAETDVLDLTVRVFKWLVYKHRGGWYDHDQHMVLRSQLSHQAVICMLGAYAARRLLDYSILVDGLLYLRKDILLIPAREELEAIGPPTVPELLRGLNQTGWLARREATSHARRSIISVLTSITGRRCRLFPAWYYTKWYNAWRTENRQSQTPDESERESFGHADKRAFTTEPEIRIAEEFADLFTLEASKLATKGLSGEEVAGTAYNEVVSVLALRYGMGGDEITQLLNRHKDIIARGWNDGK